MKEIKGFGAIIKETFAKNIPECPRCNEQLKDGDKINFFPNSGLILCNDCRSELILSTVNGANQSNIQNASKRSRYWLKKMML